MVFPSFLFRAITGNGEKMIYKSSKIAVGDQGFILKLKAELLSRKLSEKGRYFTEESLKYRTIRNMPDMEYILLYEVMKLHADLNIDTIEDIRILDGLVIYQIVEKSGIHYGLHEPYIDYETPWDHSEELRFEAHAIGKHESINPKDHYINVLDLPLLGINAVDMPVEVADIDPIVSFILSLEADTISIHKNMLAAKCRDRDKSLCLALEYLNKHPESKIQKSWINVSCFDQVGGEKGPRDTPQKIILSCCKFQFPKCKITQQRIGKILKSHK